MNADEDLGGGASLTTSPAAGTSTATDVSLLVYMERRINDLERRVEQRFTLNALALTATLSTQQDAANVALIASQKAVDKAEVATEKRFDSVNEFRAQLADQAQNFQRVDVAESQHAAIYKELAAMGERVTVLQQQQAADAGRNSGVSSTVGWLVAGGTLIVSILGLIILAANGKL